MMTAPTPEAPSPGTRWAAFKDRLAIAGVIVALLVLVFFMIDGSIFNFRCSFWQFVTFECNRWDARWKPWD
jgi:hypothetical protein